MMTIDDLFHRHVGQAYDKQVFLADSIGVQHQWAFDVATGTVTFNNRLTFRVQLVGTHSTELGTWMWAWANTESQLPEGLLRDSERLRDYGTTHHIEALTQPEFPVTEAVNGALPLNGTVLTAVASGLCEADCSYRGSYPGGELYVLIQDERFVRKISDPIGRISRLFSDMLTVMPIPDPRRALRHYATGYGLHVQDDGGALIIQGEGERTARALFDANNQFMRMES